MRENTHVGWHTPDNAITYNIQRTTVVNTLTMYSVQQPLTQSRCTAYSSRQHNHLRCTTAVNTITYDVHQPTTQSLTTYVQQPSTQSLTTYVQQPSTQSLTTYVQQPSTQSLTTYVQQPSTQSLTMYTSRQHNHLRCTTSASVFHILSETLRLH